MRILSKVVQKWARYEASKFASMEKKGSEFFTYLVKSVEGLSWNGRPELVLQFAVEDVSDQKIAWVELSSTSIRDTLEEMKRGTGRSIPE